MNKIAVIQIKGTIGVSEPLKETLKHLRLKKRNNCRIIVESPAVKGMLEKVRNLITWGYIDDSTLKLLEKKGEGPVYCLQPPKKGYGRKGIKMPFKQGGAYGDRNEKINDLIMRML